MVPGKTAVWLRFGWGIVSLSYLCFSPCLHFSLPKNDVIVLSVELLLTGFPERKCVRFRENPQISNVQGVLSSTV